MSLAAIYVNTTVLDTNNLVARVELSHGDESVVQFYLSSQKTVDDISVSALNCFLSENPIPHKLLILVYMRRPVLVEESEKLFWSCGEEPVPHKSEWDNIYDRLIAAGAVFKVKNRCEESDSLQSRLAQEINTIEASQFREI